MNLVVTELRPHDGQQRQQQLTAVGQQQQASEDKAPTKHIVNCGKYGATKQILELFQSQVYTSKKPNKSSSVVHQAKKFDAVKLYL